MTCGASLLMLGGLLVLSGARAQQCPGQTYPGGTNAGTGNHAVLKIINHSTPAACCAVCASNPLCSAWTVLDTVCRVKSGDWVLEHTGSSVSGLRAASPTAPPALLPTPPPVPLPHKVKNTLLILVDDLRPELGAYGHNTTVTPNVDKLAAGGLLFTRAYVQYSFCAPSRNSFMTGRRPDRTTCWNFVNYFREPSIGGNWTSMPQYFKEHGVLTLGTGKLYHPMLPPNYDTPYSWSFGDGSDPLNMSLPYVDPGTANPANSPWFKNPDAISGCVNQSGEAIDGDMGHWCSYNMTRMKEVYPEYGDEPLFDQQIASSAIKLLQAAAKSPNPFFIGCGFHRPHLPFAVPSEFHDLLPPTEEIKPPLHNRPPEGSPMAAWHPGSFGKPPCTYNQSVSQEQTKAYRKAYYAAVSFMDSNVGRVLDELENLGLADTTTVIFMGDHGWQLGEMDEWRKMTNWELGVRVPLIIRCPWMPASHGVKTSALVEAVDLFQTAAALAGLPDPASGQDYPKQNVQGQSLLPYLKDPPATGPGSLKQYAFSQFNKHSVNSGPYGLQPWDPCTKCNYSDWDYVGLSLRSDRWRYTEWVVWDKTAHRPTWGQFGLGGGQELYDHEGDFGADMDAASDQINLAHEEQYLELVQNLSAVLREHFLSDH